MCIRIIYLPNHDRFAILLHASNEEAKPQPSFLVMLNDTSRGQIVRLTFSIVARDLPGGKGIIVIMAKRSPKLHQAMMDKCAPN